MDVLLHNRDSWNKRVEEKDRWTQPVSREVIEGARRGEFELVLTPTKGVPRSWFPELRGIEVLCLASGGGQQGPVLAAAGAVVTVLDLSPRQLAQDRLVAEREQLALEMVEGNMADLSAFADGRFDLIFHPCSNCFAPEVRPVWRECFRVLRPGGVLLAGFVNPVRWIFDDEQMQSGHLHVRHSLPYSDLTSLNEGDQDRLILKTMRPLEFGHTLADQIGGQLDAGFLVSGFYEDRYGASDQDPLSRVMDSFMATRAVKP